MTKGVHARSQRNESPTPPRDDSAVVKASPLPQITFEACFCSRSIGQKRPNPDRGKAGLAKESFPFFRVANFMSGSSRDPLRLRPRCEGEEGPCGLVYRWLSPWLLEHGLDAWTSQQPVLQLWETATHIGLLSKAGFLVKDMSHRCLRMTILAENVNIWSAQSVLLSKCSRVADVKQATEQKLVYFLEGQDF